VQNSPLHLIPLIPEWAKASNDDSAIVLSSRVRLARNLVDEVYPNRMDTEARIRVVRQAAQAIATLPDYADGVFFSLASLTPQEIMLLVERRTISPQLARDEEPRGIFVWKERDRVIMVCEEDHIRLSEIVPGLAPQEAYKRIAPVMDHLAQSLHFDHDDNLGYLTACPANLGAAVRTSLFCHLPALVMSGGIESLAAHVADAGFTVRGFWGEGSEVLGNTFQLTDGPGLSLQTAEMLSRIESLGQEVIEREAIARIDLQTQKGIILQDKLARALAILQSCRVLSGGETLALFSAMRLGIDIGMIDGVSRQDISLLTFDLGKARLRVVLEGGSSSEVRQTYRAKRVHEVFHTARMVG
jgi:protein arginine kinase